MITGVEPGVYRLVARPGPFGGRYLAAGYLAVRAGDSGKPVVVRNGDRLAGMDIALPPAAAVEGRVIDENGEPLSMMPVVAARITAGSDEPQRVRHPPIFTDDLGRYRIYGLEPGEYIVATEGWHIVTTTFVGDPKTASATRPAERLGFAATFHPSVTSDSAAQRIRLTAGRDASGIDILVARAPWATFQEPCSTPAASRPRRPMDYSAGKPCPAKGATLSTPMRTDAFGCASSARGITGCSSGAEARSMAGWNMRISP